MRPSVYDYVYDPYKRCEKPGRCDHDGANGVLVSDLLREDGPGRVKYLLLDKLSPQEEEATAPLTLPGHRTEGTNTTTTPDLLPA